MHANREVVAVMAPRRGGDGPVMDFINLLGIFSPLVILGLVLLAR
ncbi:hypothetical protein ACIBCC_30060 [Streptomyces griseus]